MAGSKTDYLENKVLDHVLGGSDYTRAATVYLALFTARGTDPQSDAGTNLTEVTGTGYARVAVTNNATNFPAASAGSKTNGTQITFPQAGASWGTVVAVGVYDDPTAGNLLFWADLDTSKAVAVDDIVVFDVDALTFTED